MLTEGWSIWMFEVPCETPTPLNEDSLNLCFNYSMFVFHRNCVNSSHLCTEDSSVMGFLLNRPCLLPLSPTGHPE